MEPSHEPHASSPLRGRRRRYARGAGVLIAIVPLGLAALAAAGPDSAAGGGVSASAPAERSIAVRTAADETGPPSAAGVTGSAVRPIAAYHTSPEPAALPNEPGVGGDTSAASDMKNPAALVGDVVRLPSGPLGVPGIMMRAYKHAAELMSQVQPGCHLPWTLLAGIGKIESGHAGGGQADAAGNTTYRILGPVLDGHLPGNAVITDTDGGAIDGDPAFDRAVGPMQFMPGTWAHFGADGNNDGLSDPNNVYDAAFAAGRLLCASGADLSDPANTTGAILNYNHSMAYVRNVQAWANGYATGAYPTPSDLPPIDPDDTSIDADPGIDPAPTPDDLPDPPDATPDRTDRDADRRDSELIPGTGLTITTVDVPGLPGIRIPCVIDCPAPADATQQRDAHGDRHSQPAPPAPEERTGPQHAEPDHGPAPGGNEPSPAPDDAPAPQGPGLLPELPTLPDLLEQAGL